MARKPAPGAHDRILDIAGRLFDERGVRAVGLQQVIEECGCGKNLLYREFASKDDLVAAYLQRHHETWRCKVDAAIQPLAGDPAAQLLALVRLVADDIAAPDYRGCAFSNVHAEFPEPEHPAHQVAVAHREWVRDLLRDLTTQAGARDPYVLADRLHLILDGISANGAVLGPRGAAAASVAFAEDVIRFATQPAA